MISHEGQSVLRTGEPLEKARAAMILIHGRGATAESILGVCDGLALDGFALLAPQAAEHSWYPYSFMEPLQENEPKLSSALGVIRGLLEDLEAAGLEARRAMILGFSQGACLTAEFAARNARRFGGIVILSGGLIGPVGTPREYGGSLDGTPVFVGCSNTDPHIPEPRVRETTFVLTTLGGTVTERIYPSMGHTINTDEIEHVQRMVAELL